MKAAPSRSQLHVAWDQARAGIRVRLLRQGVTLAGIALGTAFFACVLSVRGTGEGASPSESSRLSWLASTSLLMCLVGVTNSMLMSVAERYREIGTIKCLGASDSFIVTVFVLEALILGMVGSVGGAAAGIAVATFFTKLSLGDFGSMLLLSSSIGLGMTLIAAIIPAVQASRMPAAAALRVEV